MAHGKTEKSTKQAMATGNYSSAIRNASFVFAGRQHDRCMRDMRLHAATKLEMATLFLYIGLLTRAPGVEYG
jgi:hypothetical protein